MNDQELIAAIRNTPTYGEEGRADLIGMGLELADALEAANHREAELQEQARIAVASEIEAHHNSNLWSVQVAELQAVIAKALDTVRGPLPDSVALGMGEDLEALGVPVAALEDAKREAWDEGLLVGQDPYGFDTTNNPYRKAE